MLTMTKPWDGEWLELVADVMAQPLTRWPTEPITRLLVQTFAAPAGAYYSQVGAGPVVLRQWPPELFAEHRAEIERWTVHEAPRVHPILRYYLATGDSAPRQVSDVPARFADARVLGAWAERCRSWGCAGVAEQVALPVHFGPGVHRAFLVGRGEPWAPDGMDLARRLQRLLVGLDRQITTLAEWSRSAGPTGTDVAKAVNLTPRELAVLELLAGGLTASSIGRRLTIAERTVQKHLQHTYTKLGVADRLAAVQRAQHIGLLPVP